MAIDRRSGWGRADSRRGDLVDAAIEYIREKGPAVSMDEIAAAAGITKPTLYRVFGSKNGLYEALAGRFIGDMLEETDQIIREFVKLDVFIERVVELTFRHVEADMNLYRFLIRRPRIERSSEDTGPGLIRFAGDMAEPLLAGRMREIGAGWLPAGLWAHSVVGMIWSAADWWVDHQEVPREVVAGEVARLLCGGFSQYQAALERMKKASDERREDGELNGESLAGVGSH